MELVKCAIILERKPTPDSDGELLIELQHEDGSELSKNEGGYISDSLVDIGRDRWKWKYGMDGEQIDKFTWSLKNTTNDLNSRKWLERCFAVTFRTIGLLIDKKYHHDRISSYTHFRDEFTSDLSVFNDRPSVLAQEYLFMPNMSKEFRGLGQWNDNHFFTPFGDALPAHMVDPVNYTEGEKNLNGDLKMLATQPMLEINMHEKCHGHGYYHDENSPESIMYPFVKKGWKITHNLATGELIRELNRDAFIWTEDDIKRWHEGYPARKGLGGWLGRMRARRLRGRRVRDVPYLVAV